MKKILVICLSILIISACNNSSTAEGSSPSTTPGADNVNGNVPDTMGSMKNGTVVDSSRKTDSGYRK